MAKLPFMQFFPSDWTDDTRPLSLAAKGAWIDMLCILHASVTRGERSMPVLAWARAIGATVDQTVAAIDELANMKIADVAKDGHGNVTVRNRRMLREDLTREQNRLRKANQREKDRGGGGVQNRLPGQSRECHGDVTDKKSEDRSQKSEDTEPPIAPQGGQAALAGGDGGGDKPQNTAPEAEFPANLPPRGANPCEDTSQMENTEKIEKKARPRDLLFDALAEATDGSPYELTRPALRACGVAKANIIHVSPDVTPEEIRRRAENYRLHMPGLTLTASALAKHWARCARPPPAGTGAGKSEFMEAF